MNDLITFHIEREDKEKISKIATEKGLSVSSFCRFELLKILKEESQ